MLFVELDGLAHLAKVNIGITEVAQGSALAASVADLAGDNKTLFVELNSIARLTEDIIGVAEVAQRALSPRGRLSRG